MTLPKWVDIETAERSAAVMARNLTGSSQTWASLFTHAQTVLTSRTDSLHTELDDTYDYEKWKDLMAAARVLDLAATKHGISDLEGRKDSAVLSACAFGMSGSAVSATAVIQNHNLLDFDLSQGELTTLALSSPTLIPNILPRLHEETKHKECIENIERFLETGGEVQHDIATQLLQEATYEETEVWEGYVLRMSRLSLVHIGRLATAKVMKSYKSEFPTGYLDRLIKSVPLLLPSQYKAVNKQKVVASDQNLLITLPPGTGKTLLGELSLLSSLGRGPGLACYIAPYVALGRQVADKMLRHIPDGVRVHQMIGSYRDPVPLDPENNLEVLIATPERFDALLRFRPDILSYIRCVVFDEAHMIGNDQRGLRLEGIITRLRLASIRGESVPRFILVSAVLSNTDALVNWIGITSANLIQGTWHPSAKRLLQWGQDGILRLHAGHDSQGTSPSEVLGTFELPWPNKNLSRSTGFGAKSSQEPYALENIAFLTKYVNELYDQPILCVCTARNRTRNLAAKVAEKFNPLDPLPKQIKDITDVIDQKYQFLTPLKYYLQRGVAYHNAGLPHEVRERIEKAVESRIIKVVAATTTLAEGVDLPFRVTIQVDWLFFDGETDKPIESLLFRNIAGRCGRAGQFTEGDTIIFDNPIGSGIYSSSERRNVQESIFFAESHPALESAIHKLKHNESVATIGSQLLPTIAENPDVENLSSLFYSHCFAFYTPQKDLAAQVVESAQEEILNSDDGQPLAIAASPIQLTPFGVAANKGGLSPRTARILRSTLANLTEREPSLQNLISVSVALLEALANTPEQTNRDLRKSVENPKSFPIVRRNDIPLVLELWLEGNSVESIFTELYSQKESKVKPDFKTWKQGVSEDSEWNNRFEQLYSYMESCVRYFLPWILRASQPLAKINNQQELPWNEWAQFVESGVGSTWGSFLFNEEVITDRAEAFQLGSKLDELMPNDTPTVEQAGLLIPRIKPSKTSS